MRKTVFFIIIYFGLILNLNAGDICSHIDMKWLETHAPFPKNAQIISKTNQFGICEVIVLINENPLPLYCGKNFFISGQMFSNKEVITAKTMDLISQKIEDKKLLEKNKENEEAEKRLLFFSKNTDKLKEFTAFEFGSQNPVSTIFVVTDPNCSHCKHLLYWLRDSSTEKKIKIKTIIYPLMGDLSRDLASKAICENFGINEYLEIKNDSKPYFCEKAETLFEKQETFFKSADLRFIPYIFEENGKWSVEGADLSELKKNLNLE
ncbi:MAG: hypothetical protein RBR08_10130 [Desulforegulaceae bacterium]|nr:hypothetical protein [Desulforegulaceae bacterium]